MKTITVTTQVELDALPSKIEGNLEIKFDNAKCAIEEISGYLYVNGTAKLDAPSLTSVGGYLSVYGTAKIDAPSLTSVGVNLGVYSSSKLDAPSLTSVGGDLYVHGTAKLDELTSVGGYLYVDGSSKLDAPSLTSVGGNLRSDGSAKLDAPALTSVGGYLHVNGTAKLDAPSLTSVGGDLSVDGTAKLPENIVKNDAKAKQMAVLLRFNLRISLRMSFLLNGFLFADGILGKIIGKKEIGSNVVYELATKGGFKKTFCVQNGETFSHGDTVEKAIEDLRYKISDRDTSKFDYWKNNLDQKITLDEAIVAYRTITGACETGTKQFVESIEIPENLTPRIVLEITKGKYGNNNLVEFLK